MSQTAYDYHYGRESQQYAFLRIPKILILDPEFHTLSTDAKLLYGLMLDRMSLSVKNGLVDQYGRVYIYFSVDEAMEQMNCASEKITRLFVELDVNKGIGLIERVKQGQGKPSRIYIKKFIREADREQNTVPRVSETEDQDFRESKNKTFENRKSRVSETESQDLRKSKIKTFENRKSRVSEIESQDFRKSKCSNTEINNTNISNTDLSIYPSQQSPIDVIEEYREQIKDNIEYPRLIQQYPYDDLDEIVDLMLEVLCTQEDFIKIGSKQIYTALAKERFLKLNSDHIEYILDCLRSTTSDIRNIKAYLLETLFNASATSGNYYKAKVNHDFHHTG